MGRITDLARPSVCPSVPFLSINSPRVDYRPTYLCRQRCRNVLRRWLQAEDTRKRRDSDKRTCRWHSWRRDVAKRANTATSQLAATADVVTRHQLLLTPPPLLQLLLLWQDTPTAAPLTHHFVVRWRHLHALSHASRPFFSYVQRPLISTSGDTAWCRTAHQRECECTANRKWMQYVSQSIYRVNLNLNPSTKITISQITS